MSFSIVFALMIPLLLTPLWCHRVFLGIYDWEKVQIASDNAGILLGRSGRDALNLLQSGQRLIARLEVAHHVAHGCALLGIPACKAEDVLLEAGIVSVSQSVYSLAQLRWRSGEAGARAKLLEAEVANASIKRPMVLPVTESRCPICFLVNGWDLKLRGEFEVLVDHPQRIRTRGWNLLEAGNWNYALE